MKHALRIRRFALLGALLAGPMPAFCAGINEEPYLRDILGTAYASAERRSQVAQALAALEPEASRKVRESAVADAENKWLALRPGLDATYAAALRKAQADFRALHERADLGKWFDVAHPTYDDYLRTVFKSRLLEFPGMKPEWNFNATISYWNLRDYLIAIRRHLPLAEDRNAAAGIIARFNELSAYASHVYFTEKDIVSLKKGIEIGRQTLADERIAKIGHSGLYEVKKSIEIGERRLLLYRDLQEAAESITKRRSFYSTSRETLVASAASAQLNISGALARLDGCVKDDTICSIDASHIRDPQVALRTPRGFFNGIRIPGLPW